MAAKQEASYVIRARDAYSFVNTKAQKAVTKTAKVVGAASLAMVASAGLVTASIFAMSKATAEAGDEFQKMSARLDISAQTLSEMKHAVELSGGSIEDYEKGLKKISKSALDADRGLITYKRSFDELGISVRDNNGQLKDSDALFLEVADGLNNLESSTRRTALAQELLGRSGVTLMPLMKAGAEGIKEMRQEANDLGITFSDFEADESAAFVDAMLRVKGTVTGTKNAFTKELIPSITIAMDSFAAAFIDVKKSGDLDKWAADTAEVVITSFAEMMKAGTQIPIAWQSIIIASKEVGSEIIHVFSSALLPLEKLYDVLEELPGDLGTPYRQAKADIIAFREGIDATATGMALSTEENEKSAESWAVWSGKSMSSIDAVLNKLKKAREARSLAGPTPEDQADPAAGGEATGATLAQADADKIISIQQKKFAKLREMTIEADLNDREMADLKLQRQLDEMNAARTLLGEDLIIKKGLQDEFDLAEDDAKFLHEKRLTEIEASEQRKRLALEQKANKLKFQTAVTGFGNILKLSGSHSKSTFKILKGLNVATALMDSKTAIMGAYKHGATIGGPILGTAFAVAAAAASAPLMSAIQGANIGGGGGSASIGGGGSPGGPPVQTQDVGAFLTTDAANREQLATQKITIQIIIPEGIPVVAPETLESLAEPLVDMLNRAGKERNLQISAETLEGVAA